MLLATLMVAAAGAGAFAGRRTLAALEPAERIQVTGITNLSGLAVSAAGLVGVTDQGEIATLGSDGTATDRLVHSGGDFEDVAATPDGNLWILDEGRGAILRHPWPGRAPTVELVPAALAPRSPNRGFEGLALRPHGAGFIATAESHPAGFLTLDAAGVREGPFRISGASSLSAVLGSPDGTEWLLVSRERGLMIASLGGEALTPWRRVEGGHLEGVALVPGRGLLLATDRARSELLIFPGLDRWEALREACLGGS